MTLFAALCNCYRLLWMCGEWEKNHREATCHFGCSARCTQRRLVCFCIFLLFECIHAEQFIRVRVILHRFTCQTFDFSLRTHWYWLCPEILSLIVNRQRAESNITIPLSNRCKYINCNWLLWFSGASVLFRSLASLQICLVFFYFAFIDIYIFAKAKYNCNGHISQKWIMLFVCARRRRRLIIIFAQRFFLSFFFTVFSCYRGLNCISCKRRSQIDSHIFIKRKLLPKWTSSFVDV